MRTLVLPLLSLLAALPACVSYDLGQEQAVTEFSSGDPEAAIARYRDDGFTGSAFLSDTEVGTVASALGKWDLAQEYFLDAAAYTKDLDREEVITPESIGEALIRWTLTERIGPYQPEGYERVMLHASLAMTYLATGSLEDALVEVRLADLILIGDEKLYEKEYAAGGLGHFLSAVCYELSGRADDAIIDYRRMEEKGIGRDLAGPELIRLYRMIGKRGEAERMIRRYGSPPDLPEPAGSIVVIAGVGVGPVKREIRMDIPTGDGILSWAVPDYVGRPQPVSHLEIHGAGRSGTYRTVVVEDVTHTATENLKDRIFWLASRSAIRAVLKRELTSYLTKEWGSWGVLVGNIFALLTERADLRSWHTLPDTWQAARIFVTPGVTRLTIEAVGGDTHELAPIEIRPGETVFVFARSAGTRLFTNVVGGRRVADGSVPAEREPLEYIPMPDQGADR